MFDGAEWWARREVKPGKQAPENFQPVEHDETTGKTVGWEPMSQSAFAKWHGAAWASAEWPADHNGNPEGFDRHVLIRHADAEQIQSGWYSDYEGKPGTTYDGLRSLLSKSFPFEGIVWHHPDGRMAKLKRRDFA